MYPPALPREAPLSMLSVDRRQTFWRNVYAGGGAHIPRPAMASPPTQSIHHRDVIETAGSPGVIERPSCTYSRPES